MKRIARFLWRLTWTATVFVGGLVAFFWVTDRTIGRMFNAHPEWLLYCIGVVLLAGIVAWVVACWKDVA